jgi:G6PDH family F420-dependent oxidoreductase
MRYGYFLSCEEYDPHQLVEQAVLAEQAGFEALWISDHYHPWNDEQGQSPFVWGVIGAVSQACRLPVTTAVTAPTVRLHPAVVAQAAATAAVQLEGRFTLGVGTGEALNEHVLGDRWPTEDVRLEMLEEAVAVMRELWKGDFVYHHGRHYRVENARVYTRPDTPPQVFVSAFGDKSFDLALRIGDGFITTNPDADRVQQWRAKAGADKPAQAGSRSASRTPRTRASASRTGSGPTPGCPASCPRCSPPRSTSSRRASW